MAGGWAAANTTGLDSHARKQKRSQYNDLDDVDDVIGSKKQRLNDGDDDIVRRSDSFANEEELQENHTKRQIDEETDEAALARLTKMYSVSMECIGSLHRLSASITKEREKKANNSSQSSRDDDKNSNMEIDDNTEEKEDDDTIKSPEFLMEQVSRVANAGRATLENVLLDPFLRQYAPSLSQAVFSYLKTQQEDTDILDNKDTVNDDEEEVLFTSSDSAYTTNNNLINSSSAHQSSLKELAYLSLVNYADLLISCTHKTRVKNNENSTMGNTKLKIINKGVVKTLPVLVMFHGQLSHKKESENKNNNDILSCWKENERIVKKFALMAYLDASELIVNTKTDTDPTLWLKLTCASRSLGNTIICYQQNLNENKKDTTTKNSEKNKNKRMLSLCKLRKLEQYAIEKGMAIFEPADTFIFLESSTSIISGEVKSRNTSRSNNNSNKIRNPSIGVPPNRVLLKMLEEWQSEQPEFEFKRLDLFLSASSDSNDDETSIETITDDKVAEEININLPRYSWYTLAKILIRGCRDGNKYLYDDQTRSNNNIMTDVTPFGSPAIAISISPMLALPFIALGTICEYLYCSNTKCTDDDSAAINIQQKEHDHRQKEELVLTFKQDINNLRSTCRALSATIVPAITLCAQHRRMIEQQEKHEQSQISTAVLNPSSNSSSSTPTPLPLDNPELEINRNSQPTQKSDSQSNYKETGGVKYSNLVMDLVTKQKEIPMSSQSELPLSSETMNTLNTLKCSLEESTTENRKEDNIDFANTQGKSQATQNNKNTIVEIQTQTQTQPSHSNEQLQQQQQQQQTPVLPSRSSKRVRSQRVSSGREAERKSIRDSVEHCVVFIVFSYNPNHSTYKNLIESRKIDWTKEVPCLAKGYSLILETASKSSVKYVASSQSSTLMGNIHPSISLSSPRVGIPSSLDTFVMKFANKTNSGPIDVMRKFLVHVSVYVDEIFFNEGNKMMHLSSCLMECYDLLSKRSGNLARSIFASCWIGDEDISLPLSLSSYGKIMDDFAINLLIAELRMKRCERFDSLEVIDYDSDVAAVSFMVPNLMKFSSAFDANQQLQHPRQQQLEKLQIRSYWLASTYYFWFSKKCKRSKDATEAERMGKEYLDKTIERLESLVSSNCIVHTPHLESPGRDGDHWRELRVSSLLAFKDHQHASLLVTNARNRFRFLQTKIQNIQSSDCDHMSTREEEPTNVKQATETEDLELILSEIYCDLLKRYSGHENIVHHHELLSDFIVYHGEELLEAATAPADTPRGPTNYSYFSSFEPSSQDSSLTDRNPNSDSPIMSKEMGKKKWGSLLWDSINISLFSLKKSAIKNKNKCAESIAQYSGKDLSLISILVICFGNSPEDSAHEESNEIDRSAAFLVLLCHLIIAAFDELRTTRKIVQQKIEEKALVNNSNCDTGESDEDDLSEEEEFNSGESKRLKKDKVFLLMIQFLVDKLSEMVLTLHSKNNDASDSTNCEDMCMSLQQIFHGPEMTAVLQNMLEESTSHLNYFHSHNHNSDSNKRLPREKNTHHYNHSSNFDLLYSSHSLLKTILSTSTKVSNMRTVSCCESSFFTSLMRIIIQYRETFTSLLVEGYSKRRGRRSEKSFHQKKVIQEAEFLSEVFSRIAYILTDKHLPDLVLTRNDLHEKKIVLRHSPILSASNKKNENEEESMKNLDDELVPLAQFCESLLWFWRYINNTDVFETESSSGRQSMNTNVKPTDRYVARRLIIPLSACIISVCGAAMGMNKDIDKFVEDGELFTSDIYPDSSNSDDEESMNEYFSEDEDEDDKSDNAENNEKSKNLSSDSWKLQQKFILKLIDRTIHCAQLVSGFFDELKYSTQATHIFSENQGPLLSLVITRVFGHISDKILLLFNDDLFSNNDDKPLKKQDALWVEEYPYGTRTVGNRLDLLLNRAYMCLHGVVLARQRNDTNQLDISSKKLQFYPPESIEAAARVFRCIKRTYHESKRLPPRLSFEMVSESLPEKPQCEIRSSIQEFIYGKPSDDLRYCQIDLTYFEDEMVIPSELACILRENNASENNIRDTSIHSTTTNEIVLSFNNYQNEEEKEISNLLRKGLAHELANSPLPVLGDRESNDETSNTNSINNDRDVFSRYEREISKKLGNIIDDLSFSPNNAERWSNAALCLNSRAAYICERLVPLHKSYDVTDFIVPGVSSQKKIVLSDLEELTKTYDQECENLNQHWIPSLGDDLHLYVEHPWSSFSSLTSLHTRICEIYDNADHNENKYSRALQEIRKMYRKKDYVSWQRAWGGIYVFALRYAARKCMSASFYLAKKACLENDNEELIFRYQETKEMVLDTMTLNFYQELQGSTLYGYPLHNMPLVKRRQLAEYSKLSFQESKNGKENSWSYVFMIGKCYEKIASTYFRERFSSSHRTYEDYMNRALDNYFTSLSKIQDFEKGGGISDSHSGGSSSGRVEPLYRLHASRLKALARAVLCYDEAAEWEAVRITSRHMYNINASDETPQAQKPKLRDKVWEIFEDIVSALADCRANSSFFHRSVYRHAQALLLAPILSDPYDKEVMKQGSLAQVAVNRAHKIRGLEAGSCAASASAVIASLFDKKRSHLVAVWVTSTGSPSFFEVLNSSSRKYDALRFKYIGSYIDCLRLNRKTDILESFIGWTSACKRDLPSFYEVSARFKGKHLQVHQNRDNLLDGSGILWNIKRYANMAIADIIVGEIRELNDGISDNDGKNKLKALKDCLKVAYSCFLRLRCPLDHEQWKIILSSDTKVVEVDALLFAFEEYSKSIGDSFNVVQSNSTDKWVQKHTLLKDVVAKVSKIFPSKLQQKRRRDTTAL